MSKVPAHFELIDDIKALRDDIAPHTKLIINGDIRDREHGLELATAHHVDGVMIGRGIFANPYAFNDTAIGEPGSVERKQALVGLLRFHLDQYDTYCTLTNRPYETLKRFYKIYIRDFDGASELRDTLMHTKTTDEVRAVLDTI
jgi:tRNA-dihydrouridine synthase